MTTLVTTKYIDMLELKGSWDYKGRRLEWGFWRGPRDQGPRILLVVVLSPSGLSRHRPGPVDIFEV